MLMGPNAVAILSQADDGLYATAPDDRGVGRELRNNPAFWREELQRVLQHLRSNDAVLNVGTNIGVMAIPIAKRCKQGRRHRSQSRLIPAVRGQLPIACG